MSAAHLAAKRRYDAKRRECPQRKLKEKARYVIRHVAKLKKSGRCQICDEVCRTVWHHWSYSNPRAVVEVCYPCHRKCHPRPVYGGKIV